MEIRDILIEKSQICLSREKYVLLYDFLVMNPFSETDLKKCCNENPELSDFNFWLIYLSRFQNTHLNGVPFSHWLIYVKKVIKICAKVCGRTLTDSEKILYPYAVAIKTHPRSKYELQNTKIFSTDQIEKILSFEFENLEQKWAMYIITTTLLEALENETSFRAHIYIKLIEVSVSFFESFDLFEKRFDYYCKRKGSYEQEKI